MKTIHIKISGRIPNYMFGILLPKYLEECETAVLYASDNIETIEDLLRLLYQTVLEGGWNGVAEFKENMDIFNEGGRSHANHLEAAPSASASDGRLLYLHSRIAE